MEELREARKENMEMPDKTMGFDKDVTHAPRGSCHALTKEGKPCKNPACYKKNSCHRTDHQLQVTEMKLHKLKEEQKEHYRGVLKNERNGVVEEAKKPFEENMKKKIKNVKSCGKKMKSCGMK